MAIPYRLQEID